MKQEFLFKQKQVPKLAMKTWIPLLQCSLDQLDSHLHSYISENPCLDVKDGFTQDRHKRKSAYAEYSNHVSNAVSEFFEEVTISGESLYEKVQKQIEAPLFPTPVSEKIAEEIIKHISDEGYFEGDIKEIAKLCDTTAQKAEAVRQRFAYLQPYGVGAVDYKEAFLFQLGEFDIDDELSILLSALILQFEKFEKFLKHPRISEAKEVIKHFKNPPALAYMEETKPIIPELFVVFKKDKLEIEINNQFYPKIEIQQPKSEEKFIKQKLKEARELVKLLDLRKATLYNITLAIVERQYNFFLGGELKPLKLQDIADMLGFNESTISRAIDNKYIQTERGIYSFKDFFSNAIGNTSASEIKFFIKRLVDSEVKESPYSDKYLHESVEERFKLVMTRRAIAKYRQELKIPAYKERKFLYQLEML
ncbi:MAG: RNA polymerase factor sigma-54 [Epsilonproteobacteria bacterium]|nr:RNA polymerase factor sigma-54 [Campylobacterota bacterium]